MKKVCKLIITIIITFFVTQKLSLDFVKTSHFNIIIVNTVFIGFLFTSLYILLGFLNERIIQFFQEAGAMKNVYKNIESGIGSSLISIIFSLINLIVVDTIKNFDIIVNFMYGLELLFLIITIYYFIKNLKNLKVIINSINIEREHIKDMENADKEAYEIINSVKENK